MRRRYLRDEGNEDLEITFMRACLEMVWGWEWWDGCGCSSGPFALYFEFYFSVRRGAVVQDNNTCIVFLCSSFHFSNVGSYASEKLRLPDPVICEIGLLLSVFVWGYLWRVRDIYFGSIVFSAWVAATREDVRGRVKWLFRYFPYEHDPVSELLCFFSGLCARLFDNYRVVLLINDVNWQSENLYSRPD